MFISILCIITFFKPVFYLFRRLLTHIDTARHTKNISNKVPKNTPNHIGGGLDPNMI